MNNKSTIGALALRYAGLFVLGVLLLFLSTGITIYSSDTVAEAVDVVMTEGAEVNIMSYAFTILVLAFIMFVVTFLQNLIIKLYSVYVQKEYKNRMAYRLQNIEYAYFDENGSGTIMNRMISDVGELNKLFSESLPTLVSAVIVVVSIIVYMLFLDWKLSLVTIIIYPILLYLANYISNKVKKHVNLRKNLLDERTTVANDCIQGIIVGKSYNLEQVQDERIGAVIDTVFANERARTEIQSLSYILEAIIGWIPVVVSYIIALFEVLNNIITPGEMLAYAVLLGIVSRNIEKIPMAVIELKESLVSVKRLNQLIEAPVENSGDSFNGVDVSTAIEFSKAEFSYDTTKEDTAVLKGVDFVAKTGEQTAIIGNSGGGKSTIFKIISGLYSLDKGQYKLYGRPIKEWDIKAARQQMAIVSQNVYLFPESIEANVSYGKEGATREEIIEACKKANIHDFIMGLPLGYDTVVGERGVRLSGGERQRISIARAFLKDAPILLLDEPTAAIDVGTERMIQDAIDKISVGKTVIVIAHRLNTVINSDMIYVLDKGVIKESGKHHELLQRQGIYADLYGKQTESEVAYEK